MASFTSDNNNILISEIIPRRDKLNAKTAQVYSFLRNEYGKRSTCFISNSNINSYFTCFE